MKSLNILTAKNFLGNKATIDANLSQAPGYHSRADGPSMANVMGFSKNTAEYPEETLMFFSYASGPIGRAAGIGHTLYNVATNQTSAAGASAGIASSLNPHARLARNVVSAAPKGTAKATNVAKVELQTSLNNPQQTVSSLAMTTSASQTVNMAPSQPVQKNLLPNEGGVGTYGKLQRESKPGDNLSAHHLPNDQYMKSRGVKRNDGIAMMVQDPFPGSGGRHREIHQTLKRQDPGLAPRDALAESVQRAREVYKKDGVYTPEIRWSLQEVIQQNKGTFPQLFKKGE